MSRYHLPGPGDEATWPPYDGHPNDPRGPLLADDDEPEDPMPLNANLPAFPVADNEHAYEGLTKREWMAAHAPADPLAWWEPPSYPYPAPMAPEDPADAAVRRRYHDWRADGSFDPSDDYKPYADAWIAYRQATDEWRVKYDRFMTYHRDVTWRYAWADAMLNIGMKA